MREVARGVHLVFELGGAYRHLIIITTILASCCTSAPLKPRDAGRTAGCLSLVEQRSATAFAERTAEHALTAPEPRLPAQPLWQRQWRWLWALF